MHLKLFFGKRTYDLELYEAQTTQDMRNAIFRLTGVHPQHQQILGLKGGVLRGDGPLSSFNIYEGQKVVLMELKPNPGAAPPPPVAAPVAAAIAKAAARRPPRGAVVATDMTECLYFMELPGELQSMVISFLSPVEVASTASVSKNWRALIDDDLLWRDYFSRRYRDPHLTVAPASWKALYARRYRSELNARAFRCKATIIPSRGGSSCVAAVKPESNNIFFANGSQLIQYELPSAQFPEGRTMRTLKGHQDRVTALCAKQDCLISGGESGNLFLWDTKKDPTPLPWHRRSVEFVGSLRGHDGAVTALHLDDNVTTLITAGVDGIVFVHDLQTASVTHRFVDESSSPVEGLALTASQGLITVHADRRIRTWNIHGVGDEPVSSHSFNVPNSGPYVAMHYNAALSLLSLASEGAVEIWDIKTWRLQQIVRQPGVTCLTYDGRFLWMGSPQGLFRHYDGTVAHVAPNPTTSVYFRGDYLFATQNNAVYFDFTQKPPPAPAAARQEPVFADEAEETNDAPDEIPAPRHQHGGDDDDHDDFGADEMDG